MQLLIRELSLLPRLPFPDNRRLVFPRRLQVRIEAVIRDICLPPDEPPGKRRVPFQHVAKRLEPVQLFASQVAPELFWIANRALIQLLISLHRADFRVGRKFFARRKPPIFQHYRINLSAHDCPLSVVSGPWPCQWAMEVGSAADWPHQLSTD